MKYFLGLFLLSAIASCQNPLKESPDETNFHNVKKNKLEQIDSSYYKYSWVKNYDYKLSLINIISPPEGYNRQSCESQSFECWLRHLPIKEDNTVYLYNGEKKHNQTAQYRIIDIDIGSNDLQQCADAVMRLRAEYLFAIDKKNSIKFNYTNGEEIPFSKWSKGYYPSLKSNKVNWISSSNDSSYKSFKKYMKNIFMYAGTASLEKELKTININEINIGDVFIKGGFPGHAVIVVDIAINENNKKCFLLAQSYMPAQNIHILKNPSNIDLSPWYSIDECQDVIETPEWTFYSNQLKRF